MKVVREEKPLACLGPLEESLKMRAKADGSIKNDLVTASSLMRGAAVELQTNSEERK